MTALIGPAIAAAAPFLLQKIFGGGKGAAGEVRALPTMAPEQQQLLGQLTGGLGGPLAGGLQNLQQMLAGGGEAFEAPAMRQFREQIIPGIAERFTGAGAQRSSAFQQALGGAGAGLAEQLAMQRAGIQQQAMQPLLQLLGLGMQQPFQYMQIPGQPGGMQQLMGGMGAGMGAGMAGMGMRGMEGLGGGLGTIANLLFRRGGAGMRPGEMYSPEAGYGWA